MTHLSDSLFDIQLLMESGGIVLWFILLASIVMWTLIIERYLYIYWLHPRHFQSVIAQWQARKDKRSWFAMQIRQGLISESRSALSRYILSIRTLTAALPMLGLLGTVDGMIYTFDVMTVFGTGNARGMAGGISIALITTMGGLLTALSGFYCISHLEQRVKRQVDNIADALTRE